jgi:hypothetical protein
MKIATEPMFVLGKVELTPHRSKGCPDENSIPLRGRPDDKN